MLSNILSGQVCGKGILKEVKALSRLESETMEAITKHFKGFGMHPEVVSVGANPTMWVLGGCTGIYEIRTAN